MNCPDLIHTESQAYQVIAGKEQAVGMKLFISAPTIADVRELLIVDASQYGDERVVYVTTQKPPTEKEPS